MITEVPRSGPFRIVIIGGSAGGFAGLKAIFSALPSDFKLPVFVVQHLHPDDDGSFSRHIAEFAKLPVVEPCDKERIEVGHVYTAPANYHMLLERDWTISLSVDEKVNWSRPSIDVLFESAASAWKEDVIAVILSGASNDGTKGMSAIKTAGGLTIAQDPAEAEHPLMPRSAIDIGAVVWVLRAKEIGQRLVEIGMRGFDSLRYGF